MDIRIEEILSPGEELLWTGKAEEFVTLDPSHKKGFIVKCIIFAVVFIAVTAAYIQYCANNGVEVKYALMLILGALIVALLMGIFQDAKRLRKAVYAATNKKFISITDTVRTVDYTSIKEAQFKTDEEGHTSLLCGKHALKAKPSSWRVICVSSPDIEEKSGICMRFAFYAVEDHEKLKEVLKPYLHI